MRSACLLPLFGLLLGCTVGNSTQPPTTEAPATEAPATEAPTPTDVADPTPTPQPEVPTTVADDAASSSSDEPSEPPSASDDGSDTPPAVAPPEPTPPAKAPVATLELPAPIHGKTNAKCGKDPGVGQSLKAFSLPPARGGKNITHRTYRGRVTVVNFWGTWCKPCLKELPEFDQLYRRYRKFGMTLLAIATDEEAEGVLEFADGRKLAAKLALAGEDYAGKYSSPNFPFTFIVDHRGVIRASYRGYKPECSGQLEADIREQLQKRAKAKASKQAK